MQMFAEPERNIPIEAEYDVCVLGGGVAGAAAALAAAREGTKTCLIEKEYALGGLATLGLIVIYLPLCDGNGRQVISGIGEEFFARVVEIWARQPARVLAQGRRSRGAQAGTVSNAL